MFLVNEETKNMKDCKLAQGGRSWLWAHLSDFKDCSSHYGGAILLLLILKIEKNPVVTA